MLKPLIRTDFIRRTGLAYRENARLSEDFLYLVAFYAAGGTGMNPPVTFTRAGLAVGVRRTLPIALGDFAFGIHRAKNDNARAEFVAKVIDERPHLAAVERVDALRQDFNSLHFDGLIRST